MIYWLLTTEYPPYYGGGISTYCYYTAQMLQQNGNQVTVFLPEDAITNVKISVEENIRIVKFGKDRSKLYSYLGYTARLSFEAAQVIKEFIIAEGKPDYIETQEYLGIGYFLLQFKHLKYEAFTGIPVILTLHSPAFLYLHYNREGTYAFPNYWTAEMEKSCIQAADIIIAPSQYIIEEIKKQAAIADDKTFVIRNPISVTPNTNYKTGITKNKILFYGKLSPQKGVFEMLAYFKELWDSGFSHPLTVIGGTDKVYYPEMKTMGSLLKAEYKSYIAKGLLLFKGSINPSERDTVMADAHVVIIPSLNDNLPYAAIEAMSSGKVVLASVQGGQAELIVHKQTGFLFNHNIEGDFALQLNTVLSKSTEELEQIGSAARDYIHSHLNYGEIYNHKIKLLQSWNRNAATTRFPFTRVYKERPLTDADNGYSKEKDLLTVIIPFFNLSDYIEECLQSIRSSTYLFIEVLVVNDGSTASEYERLLQLSRRYNFSIINQKNAGLAAARNNGARKAAGKYIAFLDADDKVHPAYYKRAVEVLQTYSNVHFTGCWVQFFGEQKHIWPTWNPEPPYILTHNSVNSSALVYKKQAFLQGGLNDKQVDYGVEDYESVINMLSHGFGGVVLPELLFFYRIRNTSMYRSFNRYKALYSYGYISQKHSDFYNTFAPQIFNILNANGPAYSFDNPTLEMNVRAEAISPRNIQGKIKDILKKNQAIKSAALYVKRKLKL